VEIRPLVRGELLLSTDTNLTTITAKKLRSWVIIPRTVVDLRGLCVSYRCVGTMGLPRDIIEEILYFHHEDLSTLKACSLTCRALFSAVRGLIHARVRLWMRRDYPPRKLVDEIAAKVLRGRRVEAHLRYLSKVGKYGLLGYAREVYIDIGLHLAPETLDTYLPYFRSFTQVHTLRISGSDLARFLPAFGQHFGQFVPTLRSLHIPHVMGDVHEVLEFVCGFPHLDDLSLVQAVPYCVNGPPRSCVEHAPSLRGRLAIRGWASTPAQLLLKVPGGLHFRSINATGVDKAELDKILVACSSDLEALSFRPRSRKFTQSYPLNSLSVTET